MNKFYLVGIGGAGVSALGHYFLDKGFYISGYDSAKSWELQYLLARNIEFTENTYNLAKLYDYDTFIKTIAVSDEMPIIKTARLLGKEVYDYPKYLGEITKNYNKVIAVCGAHGKTTVTGLCAYILTQFNLEPSYIVGGIISNFQRNGKFSKSDYLVVEACEFRESFLNLHPNIIIATNVEMDHTDYYHDMDKLKNAYWKFFQKNSVEYIVYNKDSKILNEIVQNVKDKIKIPFSIHSGDDCFSFSNFTNGSGISFSIEKNGKKVSDITSKITSIHNAYNILSVFVACDILGCDYRLFHQYVKEFAGMDRRMQSIKMGNYLIILDYAHHPTQLDSVVESLKKSYNDDFLVVFQPHQSRRLIYFEKEFLSIFGNIKNLVLTSVYGAREEINTTDLVQNFITATRRPGNVNHIFINSLRDVATYIKMSRFKTVLLAGAGDIYKIMDYL